MLCVDPFHQGLLAFTCGTCLPCRINRRRLWTHRILLESFKHAESSFLTLTYDPDHLPKDGSLDPKHVTDFLKRARKYFEPVRLRYFLCGEYGDQTFRPHYHLALFGVGPVQLAGPDLVSDPLKSLWGMGYVYAGSLTKESAQYIGGYVTKKMTAKGDKRLCGRHPEFARMSLKPGIGALAMVDVAKVLMSLTSTVFTSVSNGDVPTVLQHGQTKWPLGRYLRRKLRLELGFSNAEPRPEALQKLSEEMRRLYEEALTASKNPTEAFIKMYSDPQKILNREAKYKIYNKRGAI